MSATSQSRRERPAETSVASSVTVRREANPSPATRAAWDRLVDHSPGSDVTQLAAWGTVRALADYRSLYLLAYQDNQLVGGALIFHRNLIGVLSIGYLPYGPVIDEDVPASAGVAIALVNELTELAGEFSMTFVQPPEGAHHISDALLARGFRTSAAGIAPSGSYRLDLNPSLEQIRAGFSKRLKSWTNRWESKGVKVRRGDERDLPLLLELMAHTGARQHFTPPSQDYVTTLYRELAATGHAAIFIGEVHGKPVSADVVTVAAGMVRGRLGGFDGSGDTGKLSVPAAVRWEIIKWAKEQGYRWLDFGGLPSRMLADMIDRGIHSNNEWPSAQRGKLAFNGTPFRYPTPVELIRPAILRHSYDFAVRRPAGKRAAELTKNLLRGNIKGEHQPAPHPPLTSTDIEAANAG